MLMRNIYQQQLNQLSTLYDMAEAESILKYLYEIVFNKQFGMLWIDNADFTASEMKVLNEHFARLLDNEPIQYVLNKAFFYGREFYVDSNVLIPRNETEELVKLILDFEDRKKNLDILDLGTGSGCIPITLKLERGNYNLFGVDISAEALKIAGKNAEKFSADIQLFMADILNLESGFSLDLESSISLDLESDIFTENSPSKAEISHQKTNSQSNFLSKNKFDVIVSNPPYVLENEKASMKKNVLDYEPKLALFVPDDDALKYYQAIINALPVLLKPNGSLYLEINNLYSNELASTLKPYFTNVSIHKDFRNNERFVVANGFV